MRRPLAVLLVVAAITATVAADSSVPSQQGAGTSDEQVRAVWRSLPGSKSGCSDFDYFPDGGIRNFHCHVLPRLGLAALQKLAGVPIFVAGPHTKEKLDFESAKSFGHYNPKFVRWLPALIPSLRDAAFRPIAQPIYDAQLKPLARTHYLVYRKLQKERAFLETEKARLKKEMASKAGATDTYERFYDWGGGDGNVSKTVVAWWIRRSIDGTDKEFYAVLEQLLKVHDPAILKSDEGK
jgi:hypothetical protein